MDRIEIAIELLQEAREEKALLERYEKDRDKLPSYKDPNYRTALGAFYDKYPRPPKKSIINDNIKMARRLLLGEYKKG